MLYILNKVTDEVQQFLSDNILGTPGISMTYRQLRTVNKLLHIPKPRILLLKRYQRILAMCCLCERKLSKFTGHYIRYFSFHYKLRSSSTQTHGSRLSSGLTTEINDVLKEQLAPKELYYAYVDLNNVRSARLCKEFDFKEIRKFSTLTFSHLFPNKNARVEKIKHEEKQKIADIIRKYYTGYEFFVEENLFFEDDYFVLIDERGEIISGVQAIDEHWEINSFPGRMGTSIINVLSILPWISKLINRDFQFLALDYIFCVPGYEADLQILLESVLAIKGQNVGLIAADIESGLYKTLKKIKLGPLMKIKKPVIASIIVRSDSNNFSEIQDLSSKPAFISTLDIT